VHLDSIDFNTTALLLDIDGTLLDFALMPDGVMVAPSLKQSLQALAKMTGGALALVSGRTIRDIDRLFWPLVFSAVGGHGAEMRLASANGAGTGGPVPLPKDLRARLSAIAVLANGIIVEDKGYSLALHYRMAPQCKKAVDSEVLAIISALPPGTVEALPGKSVIEVKHSGFNKGTGIRALMECAPFKTRRPIFIGDDVTDEAGFAVMADFNGLAVSVGRTAPSAKDLFQSPTEVRQWLTRLAAA
jgi:trehalose 6-phosphate phosphatase